MLVSPPQKKFKRAELSPIPNNTEDRQTRAGSHKGSRRLIKMIEPGSYPGSVS
jgi:hypothetical protein